MTANTCVLVTNKTTEQLEREMLDYMSRIKINGHPISAG